MLYGGRSFCSLVCLSITCSSLCVCWGVCLCVCVCISADCSWNMTSRKVSSLHSPLWTPIHYLQISNSPQQVYCCKRYGLVAACHRCWDEREKQGPCTHKHTYKPHMFLFIYFFGGASWCSYHHQHLHLQRKGELVMWRNWSYLFFFLSFWRTYDSRWSPTEWKASIWVFVIVFLFFIFMYPGAFNQSQEPGRHQKQSQKKTHAVLLRQEKIAARMRWNNKSLALVFATWLVSCSSDKR